MRHIIPSFSTWRVPAINPFYQSPRTSVDSIQMRKNTNSASSNLFLPPNSIPNQRQIPRTCMPTFIITHWTLSLSSLSHSHTYAEKEKLTGPKTRSLNSCRVWTLTAQLSFLPSFEEECVSMMDITYTPYVDPEFEGLIERLHPPRVCVDNDTRPDCSLVMVDSVNKHGVLLEMVQVLTDLDLVISKSFICSDGGWLMDVFHVTDQQGNKLTDQSLIHYIEEAICTSRLTKKKGGPSIRHTHVSTEHVALEMTGTDRPGLMSEMSAALAELGCHVSAAVAWTHKGRAACIMFVEDSDKEGVVMDPARAANVRAHLENVVEAHHQEDERRSVRLAAPAPARTHTERRLHQLMAADGDYDQCCSCCSGNSEWDGVDVYGGCGKERSRGDIGTHVMIQKCKETGYSIVTVRSRDRPKLLFDTVCALTELQYVVQHAAISSQGSTAFQEYYVTHENGETLETESEKRKVTKCLVAATERRVSHGLRFNVCSKNRMGLLSDVTRILRENGLSIKGAEIGIRGENAVGTFYVKDTAGEDVDPATVEMVRREIGGCVVVGNSSPGGSASPSRTSSGGEERPRSSLGSLLWSQLGWLSDNFRTIK